VHSFIFHAEGTALLMPPCIFLRFFPCHFQVETLTIALTEVTVATADGIFALILQVLKENEVRSH
jgi:hypothetical protein